MKYLYCTPQFRVFRSLGLAAAILLSSIQPTFAFVLQKSDEANCPIGKRFYKETRTVDPSSPLFKDFQVALPAELGDLNSALDLQIHELWTKNPNLIPQAFINHLPRSLVEEINKNYKN